MKKIGTCYLLLGAAVCAFPEIARADEITDWNQLMFQLALGPPATSPLVTTRVAAIVQASVFDAVNGIERRYTPIHVWPTPPSGASARAAAVQAAYASQPLKLKQTILNLSPSPRPSQAYFIFLNIGSSVTLRKSAMITSLCQPSAT